MFSNAMGGGSSPDYAAALSSIQSMSKEQLEQLLNDQSKLDDYIKSLHQVMKPLLILDIQMCVKFLM